MNAADRFIANRPVGTNEWLAKMFADVLAFDTTAMTLDEMGRRLRAAEVIVEAIKPIHADPEIFPF